MSIYVELPIDQIELDKGNPRIANFLTTHDEEDITSDLMALLLGTTSDACASLRQSIEANHGIIHPIVVNKRADGTYVVIEGNTRLQIYKDFRRENKPGNWDTIRSIVYEDIGDEEMHKIRLQAHLVGPREWDPYSKAKYLNYLANIEHMPMASLISFCGGNSKASEIKNMIAAFNDMERYYRPLCDDDTQFDIKKFHGFVELQRSAVIESLTYNGYTKTNFSQWMIDDKFSILQREITLKQYKILKSQKTAVSYLSSANDRITFEKKLADMEKIRSKIEELRKERNRAATRKSKWDTTLKELRSLNRTLDCGELRCMDCDSTNISFSASKRSTYAFDVSSAEMRAEIIASISDQSDAYKEEIDRLSAEINSAQDELQALMSDESISLESIVAFKEKIFSASDAELRIRNIDSRLTMLSSQLQAKANTSEAKKEQQATIFNHIVSKMNEAYKSIDPNGNLLFTDIFTKRDEVFSGSEETVFHIVKLYAIRSVLGHNYPIVIDSFRAEDLSTQKESLVLKLFKEFDNQIIFTTTLKEEEMGKYYSMSEINHIDYKSHQESKILSEVYSSNFVDLLHSLSLSV